MLLIRTKIYTQSKPRPSLAKFSMKMASMAIFKILATSGLFVVFFFFFGYSSVSKFLMGDTVMVTRSEQRS